MSPLEIKQVGGPPGRQRFRSSSTSSQLILPVLLLIRCTAQIKPAAADSSLPTFIYDKTGETLELMKFDRGVIRRATGCWAAHTNADDFIVGKGGMRSLTFER